MKKRWCRREIMGLALGFGGVAGVWMTMNSPVTGGLTRMMFLGALVSVWLGAMLFVWRSGRWRWAMAFVPVLGIALFSLPGKPLPHESLREEYVRRLIRLEGVPYSWGGETAAGLDCSGLPRKALRDAMFLHGLRAMDGGALREAARHWWHDSSARALSGGYRDYVRPLAVSGVISGFENPKLLPGDLAITDDGVHVLVYLGENRWVQADPDAGRVVALDGRSDQSRWFDVPVRAFRWTVLEPGE